MVSLCDKPARVAGVRKGRKSGLLAREKHEERARKEGGNAFPASLLPRARSLTQTPFPFFFERLPRRLLCHRFYTFFPELLFFLAAKIRREKSLIHTRHYSSRTAWNSYSLKDWRCFRLICPSRWNFGKKSRLFCCPFWWPVSLQRKEKKRKCKRDRGGGKRSLLSFSAFAVSKVVSPSSYPGSRGLFSKYLIRWFSNRTGTSFDDGKARGKD